MSALTMILTAAMVVPGNGPEMVSGELIEQRLDLSGEWQGVAKGGPEWSSFSGNFTFSGGIIRFQKAPDELKSFEIIDEGEGRLSVSLWGSVPYHGIYKREDRNLLICLPNDPWSQRPMSFRASKDQHLLILHRVKSRK